MQDEESVNVSLLVTQALKAARKKGVKARVEAADMAFCLLQDEFRIAAKRAKKAALDLSLSPESILQAVFFRVRKAAPRKKWNDKAHFFRWVRLAMFSIITTNRRGKHAGKRKQPLDYVRYAYSERFSPDGDDFV